MLYVFLSRANDADEVWSKEGIDVRISGQFQHGQTSDDVPIKAADKGLEPVFQNDIFGRQFTLTISHLAAGKYSIAIGEAETYFKDPGQRLFDVDCAGTPVATNVGILKTAGEFGKICHLTCEENHLDDSVGGPLVITLTGRKENAKFNTLDIIDSSGKTVVALLASQLDDPDVAGSRDLPSVDAPEVWKDPQQPVNVRVADLVRRLSLAEKARQLDLYDGNAVLDDDQKAELGRAKTNAVFDAQRKGKTLGDLGIGAIHDVYPPPRFYNGLQKCVIQSSRLGIPALFIEEGLHGYVGKNATVFPQSVNLATTWNPELAKKTGAAIAAEARANGVDMILGPVLDIAREPRWGRVEEDFGEDPYLTGTLGLAYVQGMQGSSLDTDHTVIAEPKHFAGHGSPESGLNTSSVHVGEREMRSIMLKSFEPVIRTGGAMGVMAAYHDIDGVPCVGDSWLLNKVLRQEWGFNGFVLSDLGAIRRLRDAHHVVDSAFAAVCLAINSGVDMQFYDFDHKTFQNSIIKGVKTGKISLETLDLAVSRVLRVKFMLGLFEHPFIDETLDQRVRHSQEHLDLSLAVAHQSMCLLKNQDNLLPLKKDVESIAIIGTNANIARLGDYADGVHEGSEQGMLVQIKKMVSPSTKVLFSDGDDIDQAVALAKQAKVVVMGLGEWNGISGECFDRSDLNLPGKQQALLEAVVKTGVPVVLVLQNGRALTIPWAAEHVPSILEAWYPGELGGRAIAETLFGDNDPGGRLPVSFPHDIGQLPVYYNHFSSKGNNYVNGDDSPQFVFGYGLSYTTFKYDHLKVTAPARGSTNDVLVTFDLENTGSREGDEVAQLYVHQETSSVVTPVKALKGFTRVHLRPMESKKIQLFLKQADLELWNGDHEWKVEPGEYTVFVGGNSAAGLSSKFILE
jgi:beta-glucosidase